MPGLGKRIQPRSAFGRRARNDLQESRRLQLRHSFGSRVLAFGSLGFLEPIVERSSQAIVNSIVRRRHEIHLLHADLVGQFLLQIAQFAHIAMRLGQRFEHPIFRHLARETFDHQHRVARAGNDQIELAHFQLVVRRKRHELPIHEPQPNRAQRALKRQRRNAQGRARAVHRQHIAVCLPVAGHDEVLNLHFVVEALGEHWPNRSIDQSRGQRFLGRRPAFAFEEPAREFTGSRLPLPVITGQWKIIHPRPGRARGHRAERDRVPILHQTTTGRLLRQGACFDPQNLATNPTFDTCAL